MNTADAKLLGISLLVFGIFGPFIGSYYVASPIERNQPYALFFLFGFFVGFPFAVSTAVIWWCCLKLPKFGFSLADKYPFMFLVYALILPGSLGFLITSLIFRQFNELSTASFIAGSLCGIFSILLHSRSKIYP
jgi:hypothetical protein